MRKIRYTEEISGHGIGVAMKRTCALPYGLLALLAWRAEDRVAGSATPATPQPTSAAEASQAVDAPAADIPARCNLNDQSSAPCLASETWGFLFALPSSQGW